MKKVASASLIQLLIFLCVVGFIANYSIRSLYVPHNVGSQDFPLTQKWETKIGGAVEEVMTINNELIFARAAYSISAISAIDGSILWKKVFEERTSSVDAFGGKVYVTVKSSIFTLDENTGNTLWEQDLYYPRDGGTLVDISNHYVVVNQAAYCFSVYDMNNGRPILRIPAGRGTKRAYLIENTLYTFDDILRAYSLIDGEEIWVDEEINAIGNNTSENGTVYFSQGATVAMAYDLLNRTLLWSTPIDLSGPWGLATFRIQNDYLLVDDDNKTYIIDKYKGSILHIEKVQQPAYPQILGNEFIVLDGFDRTIHAYEIETWKKLGEIRIAPPVFIYIDHKLMESTDTTLIFANGKKLYAFE